MRRQDKYRNIEQANLMLENSYLKRKGLLKEEAEERVKITTSTSHGDLVFIGQLGRDPRYDLYHFKPEEGGFEFIPNGSSYGLPGWVNSTKEKFNNLIGRHLEIDYELGGPSISLDGEPNPGVMYIPGLLSGEEDVRIKKI
jgi:hypothetical protein